MVIELQQRLPLHQMFGLASGCEGHHYWRQDWAIDSFAPYKRPVGRGAEDSSPLPGQDLLGLIGDWLHFTHMAPG